ncbi:hypothetical protein [Candidatus Thiodubiliella endoseptemdiera]|uniref:hypothetical protein n=1 Tax=Candidatus Thiodubiliella endoseptemdiera TaxID=2738886 RepID=UPI0034DF45E4
MWIVQTRIKALFSLSQCQSCKCLRCLSSKFFVCHDWESSNITKCFSASFDYVIILSSERQHLNKIKNDISNEFKDKIKKEKLLFFTVDELMEFLDTIKANSASTESTVSGYKVKVSYVTSSEIETKI